MKLSITIKEMQKLGIYEKWLELTGFKESMIDSQDREFTINDFDFGFLDLTVEAKKIEVEK